MLLDFHLGPGEVEPRHQDEEGEDELEEGGQGDVLELWDTWGHQTRSI